MGKGILIILVSIALFASMLAGIDIAIGQNSEYPSALPSAFSALFFRNHEQQSPANRIAEENISVFPEQVVITLGRASWASYEDTNSMDPVLDDGAHGIEIPPASGESLKVGDIISFSTPLADGLVVHRIIETGRDEQGWYARTRGDNNPAADPIRVRFEDIHGVLVAVIY
ncbi:hypothetical protein HYU19_02010 [Candidatus Woesearchaeota archaeon]|nr:hypothetical protein [Candidatus Woesearchaeota archaeon]